MKNGNRRQHLMRLSSVFLISAFILAVAVLAAPFYSASATFSPNGGLQAAPSKAPANAHQIRTPLLGLKDVAGFPFRSLSPLLPLGPETIATYTSPGCTVLEQHFTTGDTVCAKVTDISDASQAIYWINPDGAVVQRDIVSSTSPSATRIVTALGTWKAYLVDSDGALRQAYIFTVSDPQLPKVDLSVFKGSTAGDISSGGFITYEIVAKNNGPDTASQVQLTDVVPTGTTYVSSSQDSGGFTRTQETPSTIWQIDSLAPGASARFTFTYQVTASAGSVISNTINIVDVTNGTDELSPNDNTWTATDVVVAGGTGVTCALDCPNSVVVTATTHGTGGGAVVDYAAPDTSGTCGPVNMTQASHTFFPIGTTTVQASADGGGFCSFTVTVIDSPAPTISCPAPMSVSTVAGSGDTQAFVPGPGGPSDPGTPTSTGTNVTVSGGRSDGQALTAAYPIGVTKITWTATECIDFPQCENGFARSASCTQTITVISPDAPTITCPSDKTFDAGGDCQKTLTAGDIGTPTTGGLNPTVSSLRSDHLDLTDPFPAGVTFITWTATNNLGLASCTQKITISTSGGDTTPPTLTIPPDVNVTTNTCSAVVDDELGTATATDTCTPAVTISRTGVPLIACVLPNVCPIACPTQGDPGRTCNESFIFPAGTTNITYTATDAAGNSVSAVQHVTVHELTPPTFTFVPPAVGPVYTGAGATSCGALVSDVTLGTATVSDNCDTTVIRSGVPAGNIFPVGQTTITYTAKADITVTATQVVTVVDNTPPTITAPGPVTLYTGPGATSCSVTVSDLNATLGTGSASDNCGGLGAITRSGVPAGNTFPLGATTVTYSVTDASNNTSSATQVVTVVDNTPPVITLNGQTPSMWPPNHKYHTFQVTDFVTGVSDNCDGPISVSNVYITKVTSDEIENGNGDGNTLNDIVIAANCRSVQLRAEREGNSDGRVYTIYFSVQDSKGNVGKATAKVVVKHNPGETAVDSGPHYTVLSNCP